uniref:Small ribosomal subunit protein uS8c n=1 Tax=Neodangemannia microcystis TaxID=173495 RepID=A0A1W6EH97_9CHLO|nr:ribosomal protein S8 [Neodangemannia microcystis]ARK14794.1 ribosomal protein S8 [Neodangemannia microcystis]
MVNDRISDMLTRIRNANLVKKEKLFIPNTRLSRNIGALLEKEGFIKSCQVNSEDELILELKYKGQNQQPCITNLRRISKPGLRIYTSHKNIPKILNGMGVVFVSTDKGLMTDQEARFNKLGGEILCSVW